MEYNGKYQIFDSSAINTYPLKERTNKVVFNNLIFPDTIDKYLTDQLLEETVRNIDILAERIISCREEGKPVILFMGAHLIKNGMGPLIVDLINRDIFTLIAGNGATAIHDFEMALIGETSEDVPNALFEGKFGMASEFTLINNALFYGNRNKLGYGETLGKMISEPIWFKQCSVEILNMEISGFTHPEVSMLAECYKRNIPFTIHAGIGVDVIDQHPSFDGEAKGGCSGRDFLIFTNEITKFINGGVGLNIGSAVHGPEVFLKAVSMSANTGKVPDNIMFADLDFKSYVKDRMTDETFSGYYNRDQKSIVTRIPTAFRGVGLYIHGNQKQTVPLLYKHIVDKL